MVLGVASTASCQAAAAMARVSAAGSCPQGNGLPRGLLLA